MAHNSTADPGALGDEFTTVDLALATYPTTGKTPASVLYTSVNTTTAPTPVTAANGLYVQPATSTTWAISAASLPLPTGASTAAKQPALGTAGTASTDVITVQGIASMTPLLATLSGTNNIATVTTVTTVGAVTSITNALPAGTNNIGDVDIVTVPADPFGANADVASATGSISAKLRFIAGTGIPITGTVTVGSHAVTNAGTFAVQAAQSGTWTVELGATDNAVLDAIAASLAGTLTVGSHAVTNAGTFAVQATCTNAGVFATQVDGAALTALQLIDDAIVADDAVFSPATTKVMMAGFQYNNITPDLVDEGDAGAARMSLNRCVLVNIRDAAGNERGLAIDANGFLTSNINGTVTVGSHAVTNAGTFAVQVDGSALTALQIMDDWDNAASDGASVSGDVAHDAADAGEPVKIGCKATTSLSGLTLVANNDRTNAFAGVDGVPITRPHCNLEDIVSGVAAITDGSSTSVIASAGAGIKIYITSVIIRNSSATDVGVDLRDGAAGSVKATFPAPPDGGGCVHTLPVPLPFSAATAVCADPSAAASTITVTLIGFKSKV